MHIVIGLVIAFVIVLIYQRRNRATRLCRWRADHTGDAGTQFKHKCAACGAETYTDTKDPPTICLAEQD